MHRRTVIALAPACLAVGLPTAFAHHGWSGFDQGRPLYLEGRVVKVAWRNLHAELTLELPADLKRPADLSTRELPAQSAAVEGPWLMAAAVLPTRRDKTWDIELAPLTRLAAWQVPEIRVGEVVSVVGYTFAGEQGAAVLRAEYLFAAGKAFGMRSSPA